MIIRPATVADISQLIVLFQEEIAHQRQITPFFDLAPHVDWERFTLAKLQNPYERVIVAEQQGQLVGYIDVWRACSAPHRSLRQIVKRLLWGNKTPSIIQRRRVGWIEDCYVQPRAQRLGVGSSLVNAGLTWLGAQDIRHVELAVLTANSGGMAFWQKQGFAPLRLLMSKDLD